MLLLAGKLLDKYYVLQVVAEGFDTPRKIVFPPDIPLGKFFPFQIRDQDHIRLLRKLDANTSDRELRCTLIGYSHGRSWQLRRICQHLGRLEYFRGYTEWSPKSAAYKCW